MKYPIPVCADCGATWPHTHPVAVRFCQEQQEKHLFNEAVARARALGRPFEDFEVFLPIWDMGIELVPQQDARFVLIREATGTQRRLWGLAPEEGAKDDNS